MPYRSEIYIKAIHQNKLKMSVLFLLKTFCSLGGAFDNQTWHLRVGYLNTILAMVGGGGRVEGANVQKLNGWGVARGGYIEVSN